MKNYSKLFVVSSITMLAILTPMFTFAATINRQLQMGMSGSDVSAVQQFLAQDETLYPQGLVTGYFGFLTKSAVSNFQNRNNISPVGRIGPATLPVLNAQMESGMNNSMQAPKISNVNVSSMQSSANISWNTDQNAKGIVYYSTSPLVANDTLTGVSISGQTVATDATFKTAQNITIGGLQANTTYYYLVYSEDQYGNISVVLPSSFATTN